MAGRELWPAGNYGRQGTMVLIMSNQAQNDVAGIPMRDPEAVIADYLGQFGANEPGAYGPDPQTLVRWLHDEGWEITPIRS
jgi:hypothetical protein